MCQLSPKELQHNNNGFTTQRYHNNNTLLRNSNGKGNLSLGWTLEIFGLIKTLSNDSAV